MGKWNTAPETLSELMFIVMNNFTSLLWINTEPFNPVRWPAMGIHGDKSQQERDWVLNGKLSSLIFTC